MRQRAFFQLLRALSPDNSSRRAVSMDEEEEVDGRRKHPDIYRASFGMIADDSASQHKRKGVRHDFSNRYSYQVTYK